MSEAHIPAPGIPPWDLHHRLARALEYADVRVGEMGAYLEVSPKTMTNYLSGRTRPRDGMLRAWALRCGVPFGWLRDGIEGPNDGGDQRLPRRACNAVVVPLKTHRSKPAPSLPKAS